MKIEILDQAELDLIEGFWFYEAKEAGLGSYFLSNLYADIESLQLYAGIHRVVYKRYYRLLSRRFPFAIFYTLHEETILIQAVVDCRRDPAWIRRHII